MDMARIARQTLDQNLPEASARSLFARDVERIRRGWERRRRHEQKVAAGRKKPKPPWDNSTGYLRREIYRLVRLFDELEHGGAIQAIVRARGAPRSPTYDENKFHWGLLAFEPATAQALSPHQRRLFASQLLYAERHNVPEAYLIGFIYQTGLGTLIFESVSGGATDPLYRSAETEF